MRPVTVSLSAAGYSAWIPLNRVAWAVNVGLGVKLSSGATLTYSVQHTMDDLYFEYTSGFTIARSGTTATVTQASHKMSAGDWIYVNSAGAPLDGDFNLAGITDANNFTYTVPSSGVTAGAGIARLQKARVFAHATLAALTASANGNYAFPPFACRLYISAYTSGSAELTVIQGNG